MQLRRLGAGGPQVSAPSWTASGRRPGYVAAMLKVFHREHAGRPLRVAWTLEELGEPYELEAMTYEQGTSEEHRARHPLVRVPVLQEDEGYVFESAAICLHLADLDPDLRLTAPLATHERALVYQWLDRKSTRLNSSHSSISY